MSKTYKLVDKIAIFRSKEKGSLGYVIPYITTQKGEANSYTKNRMEKARSWIKRSKETVEEVVENSFIQGFKVVGYTSRSRTDNKLMEISDPRGFLFQIYIADFLNLLKDVTIENGEIKDKCQWGWAETTGHCMLIPESGNIFKQSIKNEEKKELIKPLRVSEVQVGDWVTLDKDSYGGYVLYLGKLSIEGFLCISFKDFWKESREVVSIRSQATEALPTFLRVHGYSRNKRGDIEKKNGFEIFQKKTMRAFKKKDIREIELIQKSNKKSEWDENDYYCSPYLKDEFIKNMDKYFERDDICLLGRSDTRNKNAEIIKCSLKDKNGNLFHLDNYKKEIMKYV